MAQGFECGLGVKTGHGEFGWRSRYLKMGSDVSLGIRGLAFGGAEAGVSCAADQRYEVAVVM